MKTTFIIDTELAKFMRKVVRKKGKIKVMKDCICGGKITISAQG